MLGDTVTGRVSGYDSDHEALRASVRQFLEREVVGHLGEWSEGSIPNTAWHRAGEDGFLGFGIAEEFGGVGIADPRYTAVIVSEAMRVGATSIALSVVRHAAVVSALSANRELAERWLPRAAGGEIRTAVVGLDAPLLASESAGGMLVDGLAPAVVNGAVAELFLVVVDNAGAELLIAVDGSATGVERFDSAGLLGLPAAGVAAINFASAAGAVVSSDPATVMRLRAEEALGLGIAASAGAATALDIAVDYVKARKVFGRPLASFENTRFALADVAVQVSSVRALLDTCLMERTAAPLPSARAAALALAATGANVAAADAALQLHGGYGYMREYPIAQAFADARYLRLLATGVTPHELIANALGL